MLWKYPLFLCWLEITELIWDLMRSSTLTIENWWAAQGHFLCCFKGTGFENKVVYFELGISWIGIGVWVLLPLCGLAGAVLQKHHHTSSSAEAELYRTCNWNLHLPKALKSSISCDNPANWLNWWKVMNVVQSPCVAIPGS